MRQKPQQSYMFNDGQYKIEHRVSKKGGEEAISESLTSDFFVLYFISGSAFIKTQNDLISLDAQDLAVIPPRSTFSFVTNDNVECEFYILSTGEKRVSSVLLENFGEELSVVNLANYDIARGCFDRLFHYEKVSNQIKKTYYEKLMRFIVAELYINLATIRKADEEQENSSHNPFLARVIAYINSHLQTVSVKNLATNFKVSTTYIYKVLKKTLGMSPKEYITNKRLSYAKYLIENGETAWNTAFQCGYNDYSSFYRAYYKHFNVTPSEIPPEQANEQEEI